MSDFLYASPSFLTGVARTIDLGACLERSSYNMSRTPAEADLRALTNDWRAVYGDLWRAAKTVRVERPDTEK